MQQVLSVHWVNLLKYSISLSHYGSSWTFIGGSRLTSPLSRLSQKRLKLFAEYSTQETPTSHVQVYAVPFLPKSFLSKTACRFFFSANRDPISYLKLPSSNSYKYLPDREFLYFSYLVPMFLNMKKTIIHWYNKGYSHNGI